MRTTQPNENDPALEAINTEIMLFVERAMTMYMEAANVEVSYIFAMNKNFPDGNYIQIGFNSNDLEDVPTRALNLLDDVIEKINEIACDRDPSFKDKIRNVLNDWMIKLL